MVILTIKIWVIWISRTFLVSVYLSISNFSYFLTDKLKGPKIVREIQITQILIGSITISYIFCALQIPDSQSFMVTFFVDLKMGL